MIGRLERTSVVSIIDLEVLLDKLEDDRLDDGWTHLLDRDGKFRTLRTALFSVVERYQLF